MHTKKICWCYCKVSGHCYSNQKVALENENILTTLTKRSATNSVVKAAALAIDSDKNVEKALIQQLAQQPSKTEVSNLFPVAKATLHHNRKAKGLVGRPPINPRIQKTLHDFFHHCENITIYPNKQRSKSSLQPLKVLNHTSRKLYVLFCEQHPECKVSPSTFWTYKPKDVNHKPAARFLQCVCKICENITLIMSAIKLFMQRANLPVPDVINNVDNHPLCFMTLCYRNLHSPKCLERKCNKWSERPVEVLVIRWSRWKS